MKLIENKVDSTISDMKENYGPQKVAVFCIFLDLCGRLRRKSTIILTIGIMILSLPPPSVRESTQRLQAHRYIL